MWPMRASGRRSRGGSLSGKDEGVPKDALRGSAAPTQAQCLPYVCTLTSCDAFFLRRLARPGPRCSVPQDGNKQETGLQSDTIEKYRTQGSLQMHFVISLRIFARVCITDRRIILSYIDMAIGKNGLSTKISKQKARTRYSRAFFVNGN